MSRCEFRRTPPQPPESPTGEANERGLMLMRGHAGAVRAWSAAAPVPQSLRCPLEPAVRVQQLCSRQFGGRLTRLAHHPKRVRKYLLHLARQRRDRGQGRLVGWDRYQVRQRGLRCVLTRPGKVEVGIKIAAGLHLRRVDASCRQL